MAKRTLAGILCLIGQIALGFCLALWLSWLVAPIDRSEANFLKSVAVAALPPTETEKSASSLVEQGLRLYAVGRFAEAAIAWQQAVDAFQAQSNQLQQAQTLNYLALADQELGKLSEAERAIADSLQLIDQLTAPPNLKLQLRAQAMNTRGSLQLAQGQAEPALVTWQQAAASYTQLGDATGKAGSLINQAQAQQSLGFYLRVRKTLTEAQEAIQAQPDLLLRAVGLRKLGDVLRAVGDLDASQQLLEQSLALTQQNSQSPAEVLLSLGNTARAKQNMQSKTDPYRTEALTYYEASAQATSGITAVQAKLNRLSLLLESQQEPTALPLIAQIQPAIAQLPLNRAKVYAQINLIHSLIRLHESQTPRAPTWKEIAQVAAQAVTQAQQLNDPQAEAYAIGSLGGLYEKTQQ
jgi:tetratricopeptide (TPR) repeat protein